MLSRLYHAWDGRGERNSERTGDGQTPVLTCIGLGSAHHFLSNEADFLPEQAEIAYLKPWNKQAANDEPVNLALLDENADELDQRLQANAKTRVSHFEAENDVWVIMHNRDINARDQRKAALAGFHIEAWKRINHSHGGLALSRNTAGRTQLQVGSITAYRDDNRNDNWRIGIIRWLQNNESQGFSIGIKMLAENGEPVAVRAIAGAGNGGEYFRSLRLQCQTMAHPYNGIEEILIVPAHIYDVRTQLILNTHSGLQFVKLTQLLETTSTYSIFAFKLMDLSSTDYQQRMKMQLGIK